MKRGGGSRAQLHEERAIYDRFMHDALALGEAVADYAGRTELYVDGSLQALEQPEFSDRGRDARVAARARRQNRAAGSARAQPYATRADSIDRVGELRPAPVGVERGRGVIRQRLKPLGSLAIVGPVRMDYDRVIPLVEYTARALSRLMEH